MLLGISIFSSELCIIESAMYIIMLSFSGELYIVELNYAYSSVDFSSEFIVT